MRLQWSEIRARAAAFSAKYADATRERAETQSFYNDFFDCFGVSRRQVATYEARVRNLPGDRKGFIDLLWPGTLIVEQKSAGLDLRAAGNQALDYYDWLREAERPRYILTCDFQRWELLDLEEGRRWAFRLAELKNHVEAFAVHSRHPAAPSPQAIARQRQGVAVDGAAAPGARGHRLRRP